MNGSIVENAVNLILTTLKKIDAAVVPHDHIGVMPPAALEALPAVVVSFHDVVPATVGIGDFIGSFKPDPEHVSDIRGSRVAGIFHLDLWAQTLVEIEKISTEVLAIFATEKLNLRKGGFLQLDPSSYDVVQEKKVEDQPVLFRALQFKGVFEFQEVEEFGPERLVKTIHVDMDHGLSEKMDLP